MKGDKDKLKLFVVIRDELVREKAQIEARLAEINSALDQVGAPVARVAASPAAKPVRAAKAPRAAAPKQRKQNSMSLREAVIASIKAKPLTKQEILDSIVKAGYTFTTTNPMNSLGVILYGKKPKFKNDGGRFSLE